MLLWWTCTWDSACPRDLALWLAYSSCQINWNAYELLSGELNRDKKSLSCVLFSFSYFPSLLSQRVFVSRWHFFHHPNYPCVSEWTLWSHGTHRNSSQGKSANKLPTNLPEHGHSNCPKGITYFRASGLIWKEITLWSRLSSCFRFR